MAIVYLHEVVIWFSESGRVFRVEWQNIADARIGFEKNFA
jgi:hypothetical protein